jgi:HPr Serine kinase C-terminal domain
MPYQGRYYPLGFPLLIETDSEEILSAAHESWASFPRCFETPELHLRVGVTESDCGTLTTPKVRAQGHLISFIGDAENFSVGDLDAGFGYAWLTPHLVRNRAFLRYNYLDSLALTLLDAIHVSTIHAACVALEGSGVLFCGASGAGKSTLAYACARKGWQYVSDDASALVKGRSDRLVIGNPHRLRLRPDAGLIFPEFRNRFSTERVNGKVSLEIATANEPQIDRLIQCRIEHVVFLDRTPGATAILCPYPRDRALQELSSVICYGRTEQREARVSHYRNLLQVPVCQMRYQDLEEAVDCLAAMVRNREF